ncbi:hypothetical protein ASD8599_03058 [Ascidiaceihabitans donghaensis]|uniref:Uncharacterized protein n=1 Tax=Ascidiaceihabitans donghaensis TaxID=1510460 RepID=A0A2R8BH30_9RHOB|nr:hypothetical protein ASD8599_03058 [Ascidiaceihabitans donghaensis]
MIIPAGGFRLHVLMLVSVMWRTFIPDDNAATLRSVPFPFTLHQHVHPTVECHDFFSLLGHDVRKVFDHPRQVGHVFFKFVHGLVFQRYTVVSLIA